MRVAGYFDSVGEHGPMTAAQGAVRRTVDDVNAAIARQSLGQLQHWQTTLQAIANQIEDLAVRARSQSAVAIDVAPSEL
jgi:hypothetical protein